MERLYADDGVDRVQVALQRPGKGPTGWEFDTVTIFKGEVARMGGLEGLLMVEELLRSGAGISIEAELRQKLRIIREALPPDKRLPFRR